MTAFPEFDFVPPHSNRPASPGVPPTASTTTGGLMEPVVHRAVSANGIRFHLAESGQGPMVLMLHGFGQLWLNWRHQLSGLAAAGYRAVAVDLRGAGDSDKPPRGYDAFTLAADVAGLVRALGERQAVLLGHGYGGVLAFNVAVLHPDQVAAVVAVAAPHPARMARIRRPFRTDPYGRLLLFAGLPLAPDRRLVAGAGAMLERIVRSQAGPAWKASDDFLDTMAQMRLAIVVPGTAKGAVEQLRWVVRSPWRADGHRHREALETLLTAPVLHLVGEGDRFTPVSALADTKSYCAGPYQLSLIPGTGHYPAEEAPELVNERIGEFLGRYAGN